MAHRYPAVPSTIARIITGRRGFTSPMSCPETEQFTVDFVPQDPLYIHTGAVRRMRRLPVTDKSQDQRHKHQHTIAGRRPGCYLPEQRRLQEHGCTVDHHDLTEQGKPLPDHLINDIFLCVG